MRVERKIDVGYTVFIVLLIMFVGLSLAFEYTAKSVTNQTFFIVYIVLFAVSALICLFSAFFHVFDVSHREGAEEYAASAFFLSDSSPVRFLSHPVARIVTILALTLLVGVITGLAGSIVPVPNPYASEALQKTVLDQHSTFMNVWNISVLPGFFEELPVFGLINLMTFALSFVLALLLTKNARNRYNPAIFFFSMVVSVFIGSLAYFTLAHATSFGSDTVAYWSAFAFEFIVQLANQLTGTFISWLPHLVHNAVITLQTQYAFAIGGTLPSLLLLARPALLLTLLRRAQEDLRSDFRLLRSSLKIFERCSA